MTPLEKPVSRRTRREYSVLYPKARRIVVTLAPGDVLRFREAGRRQSWTLPVEAAFRHAVRLAALVAARERRGATTRP